MDDLISRQAAIDALIEYGNGRVVYISVEEAVRRIEQLPPIQPGIVRCKNCKHYEHGICKKAGLCINKSPNGFCDWGDRREVTT